MTFGSATIASLKFQELRRREGILARAALVLFLLVGAALFFVWTRSQVIEFGLSMSELREVEKQVTRHHQRLVLEMATIRRMERIERYAIENLGMIYPDTKHIRSVEGQ